MTLHHPRVAIEIGRICLKTAGKEAGRKCVIVDIIDEYKRSKNFVLVTGPKSISGVKRRRANIKHLIPTDRKVNISKGATDEEVYKALESEGLLDFMR
ncbi:MAG: 50S ribosomal protein L14e, partial [Thermoprotei archaeon]